jgi:hypothetical protein
MSAREDEHFDIDDEFLGEAEESHEFDPLLERTERRPKASAPAAKRGKAVREKPLKSMGSNRPTHEVAHYSGFCKSFN